MIFHRVELNPKEGAMDVSRGTLSARPKSLHGGRHERPGSLPGVRPAPRHRAQDDRVLHSSGLPKAEPSQKAEDRAVHRGHRPDTGGRPERFEEATPHRQAHLRASEGRVRVRWQVHHRQGLRPRAWAQDPGDVRSSVPSPWTRSMRLWRGVGGHRRGEAQDTLLRSCLCHTATASS